MRLAGHLFTTGQVTIPNNTTVSALTARSSGIVSRGVAFDQSGALAASRSATAGSSTTSIVDTATTPWTASAYVGHIVEGTSGTNLGVRRVITANTNQALTVDLAFPATMASQTFRILEPSNDMPVVTDFFVSHTATAGILRIKTRGLVNGTLTTRELAYYNSGAGTSGTSSGTGMCLPGIPGGELTLSNVTAMTGDITISGFWLNANNGQV